MNKKTKYQLKDNTMAGNILYEGWFESLKHCVEQAVKEGVCLNRVNLKGCNLACANLDDAQMVQADLSHANLNGANLSEGVFDDASFQDADLSHACFALSSLVNVDMRGTSFGNTGVTDAIIRHCIFSCVSVFTVLFYRTDIFQNCIFEHETKGAFTMAKAPVVILGLPYEIVHMDHVVKIGHDFVLKKDLVASGYRHLEFLYGQEVAKLLRPLSCTMPVDF